MKLVWRCCNDINFLWASWMRNHYVKNLNFWEAPVHILHSGTWKFIAGSRQLTKVCMRKCIGDGEGASLWYESYDPWLKESSLADHICILNPDMIRNPCWTISTLIQGNSWQLIIPSLAIVWSLIPRTDIHTQDVDYLLWTLSSKGTFTFKSAWNQTN